MTDSLSDLALKCAHLPVYDGSHEDACDKVRLHLRYERDLYCSHARARDIVDELRLFNHAVGTTIVKPAKSQWEILSVDEAEVPGLVDLLAAANHRDAIHGNLRDILIRHGDDGGWCVDTLPGSLLHTYLETIRAAAGYPDHGMVFYVVIVRS